jgi:hypothetical protein
MTDLDTWHKEHNGDNSFAAGVHNLKPVESSRLKKDDGVLNICCNSDIGLSNLNLSIFVKLNNQNLKKGVRNAIIGCVSFVDQGGSECRQILHSGGRCLQKELGHTVLPRDIFDEVIVALREGNLKTLEKLGINPEDF